MTAAMLVLEPIFEADLPPEQYACRPGRNAQQAVVEVAAVLDHGHPEVVDADLADYFGSIPHSEPLKSVARRIVGLLMIAAGYEDGNDANSLRVDPIYKMAQYFVARHQNHLRRHLFERLDDRLQIRCRARIQGVQVTDSSSQLGQGRRPVVDRSRRNQVDDWERKITFN
jgi:hypothetical protein